ncbi:hypothetical protein [Streptomyces sp. NPDC058632]|uniref:hypothetical protein n=1 Tax=Streptomyces sp. NPDC058632 TaxID=3346567 RepID=UPI0036464580
MRRAGGGCGGGIEVGGALGYVAVDELPPVRGGSADGGTDENRRPGILDAPELGRFPVAQRVDGRVEAGTAVQGGPPESGPPMNDMALPRSRMRGCRVG